MLRQSQPIRFKIKTNRHFDLQNSLILTFKCRHMHDSNDPIDVIVYKVANYGIAGHYEPHHDFLQVSCKSG